MKNRIFRYNPSAMDVSSLQTIERKTLKNLLGKSKTKRRKLSKISDPSLPPFDERQEIIIDMLGQWLGILKTAERNLRDTMNRKNLFLHPELYRLAYFICLPDLLKLKRNIRLSNREDGLSSDRRIFEQARKIIRDSIRFISELMAKTRQEYGDTHTRGTRINA